jgi:hypothetical protein
MKKSRIDLSGKRYNLAGFHQIATEKRERRPSAIDNRRLAAIGKIMGGLNRP